MKRKAKQNGSGGRLRLGLLMATVAAFLLVPASQAMAEHIGSGGPHLKLNVFAEPGASGEVITFTGGFVGTPELACNYPLGGPQGGVCEQEFKKVVGPFTVWLASMEALPGPGSKVGKWEVINGEFHSVCTPGNERCTVKTLEEGKSEENVEVNFTFENEVPNLKVNIVGLEGGGGEVASPGSSPEFPGTPPIACLLEEGASESTGTCENDMTEVEPGVWAVSLKRVLASVPNSKIVKWEVGPGFPIIGCNAGETDCLVSSAGENAEVTATFTCSFEIAPECPPPPVEAPLKIIKGGEGTVTSSPAGINCGSECEAKFEVEPSTTEVELTASAAVGSEFTGWTEVSGAPGTCTGTTSPCVITMDAAKEIEATFDLETFTLTTEAFGEGEVTAPGITCTEAGNGKPECEAEFAYGTAVTVTATPAALNSVSGLTGSGSANGSCGLPGPEEAGTCEFTITANSGVSAEFAAAESIESKSANVHGFVPQNTTLEFTEDGEGNTCADVDLGTFLANAQEDVTYAKTCGLIVTATGAENVLSAEDESETSTGHLVNAGYELTQPLETQAEGLPELLFPGEGGGTLASLESVVDLLTYGGPVNSDIVTLEFSQLIKEHDPLYTGEYAKQITLTLEQTAL